MYSWICFTFLNTNTSSGPRKQSQTMYVYKYTKVLVKNTHNKPNVWTSWFQISNWILSNSFFSFWHLNRGTAAAQPSPPMAAAATQAAAAALKRSTIPQHHIPLVFTFFLSFSMKVDFVYYLEYIGISFTSFYYYCRRGVGWPNDFHPVGWYFDHLTLKQTSSRVVDYKQNQIW